MRKYHWLVSLRDGCFVVTKGVHYYAFVTRECRVVSGPGLRLRDVQLAFEGKHAVCRARENTYVMEASIGVLAKAKSPREGEL